MKQFSGNKVTAGCVIYLFCVLGFISSIMSGYALIPEAYNVDIVAIGTAFGISPLVGFLASMAYAIIDSKIHAKGMLYIGVIATIIAGVLFFLLSGFSGLCICFIFYGAINGFATYTVITEVLSNWYVEKRADKIGIAIGAGAFGMATYQFVGGYVFNFLGFRSGYFAMAMFTAIVLFIVTKFLIVANSPEEVGQEAYGADHIQVEKQDTQASNRGEASNLYKNPTFWYAVLARIFGAGAVMFITNYATMFFGNAGMSLTTASTLISVMTLLSACFSLVSGRILGVLKVKGFLTLVVISAAFSNLAMALFGINASMLMVVLVVLFFSIGNAAQSVNNLVVDKMFTPQDVPNANSKMFAIMFAGNIVYMPFAAVIIDSMGYIALYGIMAALNILSFLFYIIALNSAKKQGIPQ